MNLLLWTNVHEPLMLIHLKKIGCRWGALPAHHWLLPCCRTYVGKRIENWSQVFFGNRNYLFFIIALFFRNAWYFLSKEIMSQTSSTNRVIVLKMKNFWTTFGTVCRCTRKLVFSIMPEAKNSYFNVIFKGKKTGCLLQLDGKVRNKENEVEISILIRLSLSCHCRKKWVSMYQKSRIIVHTI